MLNRFCFKTQFITLLTSCLIGGVAFTGGISSQKLEAAYPLIRGGELLELGHSLDALALGGAAIGLSPSGSLFPDNAAAPAALLRKDFALSAFVDEAGRSSFSVGYVHPTAVGVFGVNFYGSLLTDTNQESDFGSFFSVTANFSKRLSKLLEFGFNIAIDYNDIKLSPEALPPERGQATANDIPVGFHFDAALMVLPQIDILTSSGFSFRRVRYGIAFREIGLVPISRASDGTTLFSETIDPFVLGLGFDFLTIRPKNQRTLLKVRESIRKGFVSRFILDIGFSYPVNLGVRGGLENIIYTGSKVVPEVVLSLGSFYNPLVETYFPVTGGLTLKFAVPETDFSLKWVWLLEKPSDSFEVTGLTTAISFSATFGYRDDAAPEIDPTIFSGEGEIPRTDFKLIPPSN